MRHPEYIRFEEVESPGRVTHVWEIRTVNSNALLGRIGWFGRWRQYTFWPEPETTFNTDCLGQISAFLGAVTDRRRRERDVG